MRASNKRKKMIGYSKGLVISQTFFSFILYDSFMPT